MSRRIGLALLGSFAGILLGAGLVAGGAPWPTPYPDRSVYDDAGVLDPATEAALEARIDALESRSGAEVGIYLQVDPSKDLDTNLAAAEDLLNTWGVGRAGYDDGLVILISYQSDRVHGILSTYAGSGFKVAYLSTEEQAHLRDVVIVPYLQAHDPGAGLLAAMDVINAEVTADATSSLNFYRQVNAVVGIPGAALVLVLSAGSAFVVWRRRGDDPSVLDSPSVLMAGPPADMTPPLATVLTEGRAGDNAMRTVLVELAGAGLLRFRNLDRAGEVKRDDDPDPLNDPSIDLLDPPLGGDLPTGPSEEAYQRLVSLGGSDHTLSRESLWRVNDALGPIKKALESEAVRLGWFTRLPTPAITRGIALGMGEAVLGGVAVILGFNIPMSGLTLVGVALIVGGLVTAGFGTQMSKRTPNGAYIDAMLKAFRRTLGKTLAQARSMSEVANDPTVHVFADTPDKAVVWGVALGLHEEVGAVLARELADPQTREVVQSSGAYYPVWLGSSWSGSGGDAGSLFSNSGMPDLGGMLGTLGSIGSAPASSSGGGGFGGGGGGGGGGGSSGF